MCKIRFQRPLEWEVIYVWDEDREAPEYSQVEPLDPDVTYDVSIYDCDGKAACLQLPQGEILIAVPSTAFTVEQRCHSCENPADPDRDRVGPVGGSPRYSPDRLALEAELARQAALRWIGQSEDGYDR